MKTLHTWNIHEKHVNEQQLFKTASETFFVVRAIIAFNWLTPFALRSPQAHVPNSSRKAANSEFFCSKRTLKLLSSFELCNGFTWSLRLQLIQLRPAQLQVRDIPSTVEFLVQTQATTLPWTVCFKSGSFWTCWNTACKQAEVSEVWTEVQCRCVWCPCRM